MEKTVNVIDAFMLCHELDLLEVRLRVLYPVVDKFIIVESGTTFSGKKKPLYFDEDRFAWAADKIYYMTWIPPTGTRKGGDFDIEHAQREFTYQIAREVSAPEDIIMVSDLDEIPSREAVNVLRDITEPHALAHDFYYYNIRCPRPKKSIGTIAVKCSYNRRTMQYLRFHNRDLCRVEAGWHFSYFMDYGDIAKKLESYSHHKEYNKPEFKDSGHLSKCIAENKSLLNKQEDGEVNVNPLPDYLMDELRKYPVFMGEYAGSN